MFESTRGGVIDADITTEAGDLSRLVRGKVVCATLLREGGGRARDGETAGLRRGLRCGRRWRPF